MLVHCKGEGGRCVLCKGEGEGDVWLFVVTEKQEGCVLEYCSEEGDVCLFIARREEKDRYATRIARRQEKEMSVSLHVHRCVLDRCESSFRHYSRTIPSNVFCLHFLDINITDIFNDGREY